MTYSPMDFRLGAVVAKIDHRGDSAIGHVVGFDRNASGEAILLVHWDYGDTRSIHPANVVLDPSDWPKPWSEARCLARQRAQETAKETAPRRLPSWLLL